MLPTLSTCPRSQAVFGSHIMASISGIVDPTPVDFFSKRLVMRTYRRQILRLLAVAVMAMLGVQTSSAQSAQITGRVTDASDAVVSGAMIEVTQVDTGVRKTSVTNDSGIYVVHS